IPSEILEVHFVVAIDLSKCLVHNVGFRWHRQLTKDFCVGREDKLCNNISLNATFSDYWYVDYPGLFISEALEVFLLGRKCCATCRPVRYGQACADGNNASPNTCY